MCLVLSVWGSEASPLLASISARLDKLYLQLRDISLDVECWRSDAFRLQGPTPPPLPVVEPKAGSLSEEDFEKNLAGDRVSFEEPQVGADPGGGY